MIQQRTREQALLEISRLQARHSVGNYNIIIKNRCGKKATVAQCNPFNRTFEFEEFYALHLLEKDFIEIMLHEIAHALTPGHGHDSYFKSVCRRIGGTPGAKIRLEYLHNCMPEHLTPRKMTYKYIYVCPSCAKETHTTKVWKKNRSCGICSGGHFNPAYLLKLKEN